MCAIVDANVAYEVFGSDRPPAGKRFFDWLSSPRGQLVVGGKLREELARDRRFVQWLRSALRNGGLQEIGWIGGSAVDTGGVEIKTAEVKVDGVAEALAVTKAAR